MRAHEVVRRSGGLRGSGQVARGARGAGPPGALPLPPDQRVAETQARLEAGVRRQLVAFAGLVTEA